MLEYFKQVIFSPSPDPKLQSRVSQRNYKSVQSRGFAQQKPNFDYSHQKPALGKHHQAASSQVHKKVFEMRHTQRKIDSEEDQERINTIPLMDQVDAEYFEQTNFFEKNPRDIFNETILFEHRNKVHKASHNSSLTQTAKIFQTSQLGATQKTNKVKILEQPLSDLNDTQPIHESEEDSHIEEEGTADLQDDMNRNQIVLRSPMNKIHSTMHPVKNFQTQFREGRNGSVPSDQKNNVLYSKEGSVDSLRLQEQEELVRNRPQQSKFARGSVAAVSTSSENRSINPRELTRLNNFVRRSEDMLAETQKIDSLSKNHNPAHFRVQKNVNPFQFNQDSLVLDLSRSNLENIPKEVFKMERLEELYLDENRIKEIPDEIQNLKFLKILSLSKNMIEEIPIQFEKLTSLEKLNLSQNSIQTIPDVFQYFTNLKSLLLETNQLNQIPQSLGYLKSLEEISLDWFCYLNPPKPKAIIEQKEPHLFASFLDFCLQRAEKRVSKLDESPQIQQRSYKKNQRNFKSHKVSLQISTEDEFVTQRENTKTFLKFLQAFYQLENVAEVNKIKFQTKSKTLIHEIIKNQHGFLLKQLCAEESIDVNLIDEEGLTALNFTFQQNTPALARILLASRRCDIEKKASGVNYPLHAATFKQKFLLANEMIMKWKAKVNVQNTYGSNVLHILFANFERDKKNARTFATNLISKGVELNLVDNNGFSPIHVAIKKEQTEAIRFAIDHNKRSKNREDLWFDFDVQGKQGVTPLHMSIMKSNIEAFRLMIEAQVCNFFVRDDMLDLPRHKAIINSVYYRILYRKEKNYYKKEAASRDVSPLMLQSIKNYQEFRKEIMTQQEMQFKSYDFSYLYDKPQMSQSVTKVNQLVKQSFQKTAVGCETPGKSNFFNENKNKIKHTYISYRAFNHKKVNRNHYNSASVTAGTKSIHTAHAKTKRVLNLPNKESHKLLHFSSDSDQDTPRRPLSPGTKPQRGDQNQIFQTQKFPKGALKAFAMKKQNFEEVNPAHNKKQNFNHTLGQQKATQDANEKKIQKRRNTAGTTGSVQLMKGTLNASKNLKSQSSVQRKPKNQKIINSINHKIFGDRSPSPELMDCSRAHDEPPQTMKYYDNKTVVINNIFINSLSIAIQSKKNDLSEDSADNQSSVTEGLDQVNSLAETKKQIAFEISSPPTPKSFIDPLSCESNRNHATRNLQTTQGDFGKDEFGNECFKVLGSRQQFNQFKSKENSNYANGMSGFSGTERSLGRDERSEMPKNFQEEIQNQQAFIGSFHNKAGSFHNPMIITQSPLKEEITPLKSSGSQRKIQTIVTQNNLNRQAFHNVLQQHKKQTDLASISQESQDADLSVINDEVPVKKEINSEMKSNYLKSLINQYEPDIVKQLQMNLQSPELSPRQFSQTQNFNANNVFINSCQVISSKDEKSLHSRMQSSKNQKVAENQQFNFIQKEDPSGKLKGKDRLEISSNKYGDIFFFVVEKKDVKFSEAFNKIYKELVPRLPSSSEARFILNKIVQKLPTDSLLKPDLLYLQSMHCQESSNKVQEMIQKPKQTKKSTFSTIPSSCQVLLSQEGVNSILNTHQNNLQRSQTISTKLPKKSEKLQQYLQQSQQMTRLQDQIGIIKQKPVNGSQGLLTKQKGAPKTLPQNPRKVATSEGETIQMIKKKHNKQRYS